MSSVLDLTKTNKLVFAALVFLAVLVLGSNRAQAATLNVSGGCTLPIAIDSVNAGADQAGCTASGSYGSSDTITLPAGTITLSADLPQITAPVTINGAGMGQTVISGDNGQYRGFEIDNSGSISISNLTVVAYYNYAIITENANVTLNNIEVDGAGALSNDMMWGIYIHNGSGTHTVNSSGVYLHSINATGSDGLFVYLVEQNNGGTTNANINNTTVTDVHSDYAANVIAMGLGMMQGLGSTGTINSTVTNTTIHNVSSDTVIGPFTNVAFALGGNGAVNTNVYNATITGLRGHTGSTFPTVGVKSAAFYAASAGMTSGSVGTATVNVSNSLFADNLNDGLPSNCSTIDLSTNLGGLGLGVTSINSLGHNISDDASCPSFTQPGDQQNVANIISTLGPLQNNGGAVSTRALLAGSPAIASGGSVLGVTTDARGVARPGDCPSVGAYQFVGAVCGASTPASNAGSSGGNSNTPTAPNTGTKSAASSFVVALALSLMGIGSIYAVGRRNYVE